MPSHERRAQHAGPCSAGEEPTVTRHLVTRQDILFGTGDRLSRGIPRLAFHCAMPHIHRQCARKQ